MIIVLICLGIILSMLSISVIGWVLYGLFSDFPTDSGEDSSTWPGHFS